MRLIALIILVIPGIAATLGIKWMRDAFFGEYHPWFFHVVIQFAAGLIFFLAGIAFIGGFILFRDRKRNLTKGKFKNTK
ncbi:DUF2627 domain-containing protein [Virgibacillus senegalensis]|uniref:DUF2627 domain-containing protein n=1 Tax=Virgibacillus senegalensis TaxID=1499679 RepID=UPI00069EE567|nr:DUF2627 domain-containing protein [Virgibacillus senegalensis]